MPKYGSYPSGAPAQLTDKALVNRSTSDLTLTVEDVLTALHALTAVTPALTTDEVLLNRSGVAKKATVADVIALASASVKRNLLINGNFVVNQAAYASGAALAAGNYGHDGWKAGASGGDYTFTQLPNSTTITIATGKSLIQVVEDKMVEGGSYAVSWTGTAQGRAGANTAVPSGSYAASPIIINSQLAGTTFSVEFNTGTLGEVMVAPGTAAATFERLNYDQQLARCLRYFRVLGKGLPGFWFSATQFALGSPIVPPMRGAPTIALTTTTPVVVDTAVRTGSGSAIATLNTAPSANGWNRIINGFTGATAGVGGTLDGDVITLAARL